MDEQARISRLFVGNNFMTPRVVEYGWISKSKKIAYELSESGTFCGPLCMTGVTVANKDGLNKSFTGDNRADAMGQAKQYIGQLKGDYGYEE